MEEVKVSVCIFTYNHEKYIEHCIESVLMQKADFNFEIILGEDYSKDNTRTLCESYAEKYPEKIRLLDRGKNLGMCENIFDTLKKAKGDYVAILDGDDYWIHPLKLKKQFDYLEANKEMNLVFHQTIRINELSGEIDLFVKEDKNSYKFDDNIGEWLMATGAMFFRRKAMDYPGFLSHTHNFDLVIQLIVNRDGNEMGYLNDIMSVYRINAGSNTNKAEYDFINTWIRQILLLEEFDEYSNRIYSERIKVKINELNYFIKQYNHFSFKEEFKSFLKNLIKSIGYRVTISKL